MKVQIKDGKLIIEIDMQKPTPSAKGKTLLVATSHGGQRTEVEVEGKPVTVNLNAYIYR